MSKGWRYALTIIVGVLLMGGLGLLLDTAHGMQYFTVAMGGVVVGLKAMDDLDNDDDD